MHAKFGNVEKYFGHGKVYINCNEHTTKNMKKNSQLRNIREVGNNQNYQKNTMNMDMSSPIFSCSGN